MTNEEAIKLIDDRMCFGRGKWSEHHRPVIDEYWQAGEMAIKALEAEPHWIPVTEPPKGDFMPYYATCRSKEDDRENWVIEGMYTKYSGWEYPPMVRDGRAEIIAWMPKELPEPFKGVTDGRD